MTRLLRGLFLAFSLVAAGSAVAFGVSTSNYGSLTGVWKANDGGTYYLRVVGDKLWWFGEGRGWANVFRGTLRGNDIVGEWADVPKNRNRGSGQLSLRIVNANLLHRSAVSGGFGGSKWWRGEQPQVQPVTPKPVPANPLPPKPKYPKGAKLDSATGHAYRLSNKRATWSEALRLCQRQGAHLATITSRHENTFIARHFDGSRRIWLGASDSKVEGQWRWVTGEPFTFNSFDKGEPNNGDGGEDYLELGDNGRWNDDGLPKRDRDFYYLCEWEPR